MINATLVLSNRKRFFLNKLGYKEFLPLQGQYPFRILFFLSVEKISLKGFESLTESLPDFPYLQLVTEKTTFKSLVSR